MDLNDVAQAVQDGEEIVGMWYGTVFVWPDPWWDIWADESPQLWEDVWHNAWTPNEAVVRR